MSKNLLVRATREVIIKKTGEMSKQTLDFRLWKPTESVISEVLGSKESLSVYTAWASQFSKDDKEPIYALDDLNGEREPVDYIVNNPFKNHIRELKQWIGKCKKDGYTVEFYEK